MATVSTGPTAATNCWGDHLRAAPVLSLAAQKKTGIADEIDVALVVVMVHPGGQPAAQAVDEWDGDAREGRAAALGCEADVQHHHPTGQGIGGRQLPRRQERKAHAAASLYLVRAHRLGLKIAAARRPSHQFLP